MVLCLPSAQVDCHIPLSPSFPHDLDRVRMYMSQIPEEQLHKVRLYLGASKLLHYRLTPEIQKVRLGGNDLGCSQFYQLSARIMHGSSCSYT